MKRYKSDGKGIGWFFPLFFLFLLIFSTFMD